MKKGFTLLELIIVIIIIGIIMGIALPRYINVSEKIRAAEGIGILGALRSAQMRYYLQFGDYSVVGDCSNTDTPITSFGTVKYFKFSACTNFAWFGSTVVAASTRMDESYTLFMYENGNIWCSNPAICPGLGF